MTTLGNYTFNYFYKNYDNKTFKELLDIQGEYSHITLVDLFGENRTPNENRALGSLMSGVNDVQPVKTLEGLLNLRFFDLVRLRSIGEGAQTLIINHILNYFDLGEIAPNSKQREINHNLFTKNVEKMDTEEMKKLLVTLFKNMPVSQQNYLLKKL
jgi:hypothetical protein